MEFETFNPTTELLKKHIAYYYFFKSEASDFSSGYYSFPNVTTPLNIYKNVDVVINGPKVNIAESDVKNYRIIINQVREAPLHVEWKGSPSRNVQAFVMPYWIKGIGF
ncbi:hypothetical protein [Pedobacter alluvionis]|uniref:Uncharacterized protein n=1 Tax=Pedobacter alluvionis TaxID=475253 RepID=A0ABY2HML6_9SPHI|nr:hypothetical protein [Pedobacter alluvionis]TFB30868.1 hypothetical protein E3V97_09530 [Pedobacter alluvionis]